MTQKFFEKWEKGEGGVRGALHPVKPIRTLISSAISRVENQLNQINSYIERYTQRDKELSEKIIQSYERHDDAHAKILANELAETRKQKTLLTNSKLSLDKAILRLRTVYEFGNFTSVITSARGAIQEVRSGISGLIPGLDTELNNIDKILNNAMLEIGQIANANMKFSAEEGEAKKILKEAAMIVESKIKMKLPESPESSSNEKVQ